MNKLIIAIVWVMTLGSVLWSAPDQTPTTVEGDASKLVTFTTKDGKSYTNAKVSMTDTGLSVLTSNGGGSVDFSQVPDDISAFSESTQARIKAWRSATTGPGTTPTVNGSSVKATDTSKDLSAQQPTTNGDSQTNSACARLGESMDQIVKRHASNKITVHQTFARLNDGNITSLRIDVINFTYSGFDVQVTCLKGVSAKELFSKPNTISVEEANVLLDANSQGHSWILVGTPTIRTNREGIRYYYGGAKWQRDDNATASVLNNYCSLSTGDLDKAASAADQADSKDNVHGF